MRNISNDTKLKIIEEVLENYPLALYSDDVSINYPAKEIEEKAISALQLAIWDLRSNTKLIKAGINEEKIKLNGGYMLNAKEKILELLVSYEDSNKKTITLKFWPFKKIELFNAINKEINDNVKMTANKESRWHSTVFTFSFGEKLCDEILEKFSNKSKIKVKEEEVIWYPNLTKFVSWDWESVEHKIANFNFDYLNISDDTLTLNVKVIDENDKNNLVEKLLSKSEDTSFLKLNLSKELPWNDSEQIKNTINESIEQVLDKINIVAKPLGYEIKKSLIKIQRVTNFGPLENRIIAYISINNSKTFIPITMKFKNQILKDEIDKFEKQVNEIFKNSYLKSEVIERLNKEQILDILKVLIENKNDLIINGNQLSLENKEIIEENDKKYLKTIITLKDSQKDLNFYLNLI